MQHQIRKIPHPHRIPRVCQDPEHMPSMNCIDFDNVSVRTAANPSGHGHHHGPIPNPNAGYVPARQAAAIAAAPDVSIAENIAAPNPGSVLSGINGGVCDIDLGNGDMCGVVFGNQPSMRRHIRNQHAGALINPNRTNISIQETRDGHNALKRWVLTCGWRNARYIMEPGRGPVGGLIDRYATACEAIARIDPAFAATFGDQFHRATHPVLHAQRMRGIFPNDTLVPTEVEPVEKACETLHIPEPTSSARRKRGPSPPDDQDDPPSPSAGPAAKKRKRAPVKKSKQPADRVRRSGRGQAAA